MRRVREITAARRPREYGRVGQVAQTSRLSPTKREPDQQGSVAEGGRERHHATKALPEQHANLTNLLPSGRLLYQLNRLLPGAIKAEEVSSGAPKWPK